MYQSKTGHPVLQFRHKQKGKLMIFELDNYRHKYGCRKQQKNVTFNDIHTDYVKICDNEVCQVLFIFLDIQRFYSHSFFCSVFLCPPDIDNN